MEKIPSPPVLTLDPNDDNIILEIPEDKDPNEKTTEPVKKEKVKVDHWSKNAFSENSPEYFHWYLSFIYLFSIIIFDQRFLEKFG